MVLYDEWCVGLCEIECYWCVYYVKVDEFDCGLYGVVFMVGGDDCGCQYCSVFVCLLFGLCECVSCVVVVM